MGQVKHIYAPKSILAPFILMGKLQSVLGPKDLATAARIVVAGFDFDECGNVMAC